MPVADTKPYLMYYVHAHGSGHRRTFELLYPSLRKYYNIIAITTHSDATVAIQNYPGITVKQLSPKWPLGTTPPAHTFSKAFEETPYDRAPRERIADLLDVIDQYRPVAFYCDGSPELAIMTRGMGVPVVLVHLPGNTTADPTQAFAYELADHIIAHFPATLEQPGYFYGSKTFYSGYISRYAGTVINDGSDSIVTIVLGYDNYGEEILQAMTANKKTDFVIIGNRRQFDLGENCQQLGRVADIAPAVKGRVVITAAGQNTIAELVSLGKRLVLLPEPRPYNEQRTHAAVLADKHLVLPANTEFTAKDWISIISAAQSLSPDYSGLINPAGPVAIADKLKEWYA